VTSITTHASYYELNGSFVDGVGFSNDEIISFDFTQTGNVGDTGATGPTGPTGVVTATAPITYNSGTQTVGIDLTNIAQRNTANTFTVGGHVINNSGTTVTPLVLRGVASQTSNMFEIQDETFGTYASISKFGTTRLGGSTMTGGRLMIAAGGSLVGIQVRDGGGGANMQEWQSGAGAIQARVTSGGSMVTTQGFAVLGGASISGSTAALFQSSSAGRIPVTVQGAASASVNLQEWQNSAGAVLARINQNGQILSSVAILGATVETSNGHTSIREGFSGGMLQVTKATAAQNNPGANIGRIYFRDGTNAGTLKLVVRAGAAGAETTILDNIPQ
jgi:hypothetical protein